MRPAGRYCAGALPVRSLGTPEAGSHSLALRWLADLEVRCRLPPRCSTGCRRVRGGADVRSQDGGGGRGLLEARLPGYRSGQSRPAGEPRGRGSVGSRACPRGCWGGEAAERRREPGSRPREAVSPAPWPGASRPLAVPRLATAGESRPGGGWKRSADRQRSGRAGELFKVTGQASDADMQPCVKGGWDPGGQVATSRGG